MRRQSAPDLQIAELADRQEGVVTRRQLRALGFTASAVDRRLRAGRLHVLLPGVYAVGHRRVGLGGRRWVAVLWSGGGAVLSHASAAAAWGFRPSGGAALIHVTVPARTGRRSRDWVRVHRPSRIAADEVTALDALPITTPARTLLDLAATGLRGRRLEAALDRAEHMRLIDFADLGRLLARHGGRRGAPALAAVLARYQPADTHSVLEEIVLELCDQHGIPQPLVNTVVLGRERDFYWPERRLVVEADSYAWHRSPSALNDDRERDVELVLAGHIGLRFTYEQCTRRRVYVAKSILKAHGAK
jgi:Transcriptional regulator, AbiEi antitoxin